MPRYLVRLIIIFVLGAVAVLAIRQFMVPASFYQLGHYRASVLPEVAAQEPVYAGHAACEECHGDVLEVKEKGRHTGLSCEVCHGAAATHAADPSSTKPFTELDRSFCLVCHEKNISRPAGFPMVDGLAHNIKEDCRKCHKPHSPSPNKGEEK
ncbi:MAG: hypothetical protein A3K19_06470 [Lentisphaerae bacterium RIFOXYB12_FULL_65_16]|nr:MAG: hypothetical protein A3K18_02170 [Lentisphaerae bacterium RIFOXYA12_64_32]OGV93083.1 MAG: hypothetical protein A3K19_06470 [Lentisphaerae bacterium RIFOXYB12_FULL_65_16]